MGDFMALAKFLIDGGTDLKEKELLFSLIDLAKNDKTALDKMEKTLDSFLRADNKYSKHNVNKSKQHTIKYCDSYVSIPIESCNYTTAVTTNDIYCTLSNINLVSNPSKECK